MLALFLLVLLEESKVRRVVLGASLLLESPLLSLLTLALPLWDGLKKSVMR